MKTDAENIALQNALSRADTYAPYLRQSLGLLPELAALLADGDWDAAQQWAASDADTEQDIALRLRRQKRSLALIIAIGDLAGLLSLEQVTQRLTQFADAALNAALTAIFAERTPGAAVQGFTVIALGKHGSGELNYSSDIDPIFLYDPASLPTRPREEPSEAARRIGNRLVQLLSERTAAGYVFRVDMRLRPNPEVSPVALPVDAAVRYYESRAAGWEQAAFIRARACAGDIALGEEFLARIRPFVWRRNLDYGAIEQLGRLTHQIRDHFAKGQGFGPGFDLKRGRGGIREAEFYAQMHQLVFGGREPALRAPATVPALVALAAAGRIDADVAAQLSAGYRCLRTIEHRLQMVDDQQTHSLPTTAEALDNVAALHGLASGEALLGLLAPQVSAIGRHYDAILAQSEAPPGWPMAPDGLHERLIALGIVEAELFARRIGRWRSGQLRALQSEAAQAAFERVLPELIAAIAASPNPVEALNRLDSLFERLPSVLNIFHLLEARPQLRERLARILAHAPTLAQELARKVALLDGLIDASALDLPPPVEQLAARFGVGEADDDYQRTLDRVRDHVGEQRFALGVQLIEGAHDPLAIAQGYARIAEAAIAALVPATIAEFARTHGAVPDSELVLLAFGRLGGSELTHASDLDLVFLFTGDVGRESDGRRPLGATRYFNSLAQRLISALSAPTAAGKLYEVDTRLRPWGAKGLLAVSVDSFLKYQREEAWTWEHMALTRARVVYGSAPVAATLTQEINAVLAAPRAPEALRKAVRKMRLEMVTHKPPLGPLDAKLIEGGLVDWEFIVHFVQLHSGQGLTPHLPDAVCALVAAGLLAPAMVDAHALLTRLLIALRLIAPDGHYPPEASRALIARAAGTDQWDRLLAQFAASRQMVIAEWNRLLRPDPNETFGDLS